MEYSIMWGYILWLFFVNAVAIAYACYKKRKDAEYIKSLQEDAKNKELPPEFQLISVEYNAKRNSAKIRILETKHYRTIERYVTRKYVKYPVLSHWKKRTKTHEVTLRFNEISLKSVVHHSNQAVKSCSAEIINRLQDKVKDTPQYSSLEPSRPTKSSSHSPDPQSYYYPDKHNVDFSEYTPDEYRKTQLKYSEPNRANSDTVEYPRGFAPIPDRPLRKLQTTALDFAYSRNYDKLVDCIKDALNTADMEKDAMQVHYIISNVLNIVYTYRQLDDVYEIVYWLCDIELTNAPNLFKADEYMRTCLSAATKKAIMLEEQGFIELAIEHCRMCIDMEIKDLGYSSFDARIEHLKRKA